MIKLNCGEKKVYCRWHRWFEINSIFHTSVWRLFFYFSCAENMVRVIEGKIIYNRPESKKWVGVNLLKSKILSITCLSEEVCCAESAVTSIKFEYNSPTCMCHPQFWALNSFSTVLNFTIPRVGICTVNAVSFLRLMTSKDLNKRKQEVNVYFTNGCVKTEV